MTEEQIAERKAWLAALAIGDIVVIRCESEYGSKDRFLKSKIDDATKANVIISNSKYRRSDGDLVGNRNRGNVYIVPLTDEIRSIWRQNALESRIAKFCNDIAYGKIRIDELSAEKLAALDAAIKLDPPATPEK